MNFISIVCIGIFLILLIIQAYCNHRLSKIDDEYEKLVDQLNKDDLKISFLKNHITNRKLYGISSLIGLLIGIIISIGLFNSDFQKMGVENYLRGNIEVKYQQTYEDNSLIKCDTIIKFKEYKK